MALNVTTPGSKMLLTAALIEAALGGSPVLEDDLSKKTVTGLRYGESGEFEHGDVSLNKEKLLALLNLEKVQNKTSEEILAELTQEDIEKLLGNVDYDGEDVLGILDQVKEAADEIEKIKELLGSFEGDEDGDGTSLLDRVEALESGLEDAEGDIKDLQDNKLDKNKFTATEIEKLFGFNWEDEEDVENLKDAIEKALAELKNKLEASDLEGINTSISDLEGKVEDIEEALGLGEDNESGTSIMDRLGAVEEKADSNAGRLDSIEEALGLGEEGDGEQGSSILDRIQSLEDKDEELEKSIGELEEAQETLSQDLEDYKEEVENTYLKSDDFTRESILELIAEDVESSHDPVYNYTLVTTKWKEADGDKEGFMCYEITATELKLDDPIETENDDFELFLAPSVSYVAAMAASEAGFLNVGKVDPVKQSLTVYAMETPVMDLPFVIRRDVHKVKVEED